VRTARATAGRMAGVAGTERGHIAAEHDDVPAGEHCPGRTCSTFRMTVTGKVEHPAETARDTRNRGLGWGRTHPVELGGVTGAVTLGAVKDRWDDDRG